MIDFEKIEEYLSKEKISFSKSRDVIKFSPRFIHFDEFYLFWFIQKIHGKNTFEISDIISNYVDLANIDETQFPIAIDEMPCIPNTPKNEDRCDDKNPKISAYHIRIPKQISTGKCEKQTFTIGIANIKVNKNIWNLVIILVDHQYYPSNVKKL